MSTSMDSASGMLSGTVGKLDKMIQAKTGKYFLFVVKIQILSIVLISPFKSGRTKLFSCRLISYSFANLFFETSQNIVNRNRHMWHLVVFIVVIFVLLWLFSGSARAPAAGQVIDQP